MSKYKIFIHLLIECFAEYVQNSSSFVFFGIIALFDC